MRIKWGNIYKVVYVSYYFYYKIISIGIKLEKDFEIDLGYVKFRVFLSYLNDFI